MRKNIAWMMAFVLSASVLPPVHIQASEVVEEKQATVRKKPPVIDITNLSVPNGDEPAKGIAYSASKGKFELVTLENPDNTEEVAMSWAIEEESGVNLGIYSLSYYLMDATKPEDQNTNRIQIDFHVGSEVAKQDAADPVPDGWAPVVGQDGVISKTSMTNIGITVRMYGTDDLSNPINTIYQPYSTPPYDVSDGPEETDTFVTNISMSNAATPQEKTLKVRVGNYTPIRLYQEDGHIYLSVGNVEKGNITPITLGYKSVDPSQQTEVGGFVAFKGLEELQVTPTHLVGKDEIGTEEGKIDPKYLSDDTLPSQEVIPLEQIKLGDDQAPGGRPGVLVSFDRPQVVDEATGDFKFIDTLEAPAGNTEAKLLFMKQYASSDSSSGSAGERTYDVNFGLNGDNLGIYREGVEGSEQGTAVINEETDKFELYFATDQYGYEKEVHIWDELKAGMILQAHLEFEGQYFDGNYFESVTSPEYEVTNNESQTLRSGNTYMWYKMSRSASEQLTFEIDPYDIAAGKITYNLFRDDDKENAKVPIEIRHYEAEDLTGRIRIATDMISGQVDYFLNIQINDGSGGFSSQIITANTEDLPIPAPYPEIKSIDNVYVVRNQDANKEHIPDSVGMDITWHVPDDLRDYLADGSIMYYELSMSDEEENGYTPTKVFQVREDSAHTPTPEKPEADILVSVYAGTVEEEGTHEEKVARYDAEENTITVENIVLKQQGPEKWEALEFKPDNYLIASEYPEVTDESGKNGIFVNKAANAYTIPDTFYFKMRSVYQKKGEPQLAASGDSTPAILSLDITKEVLPTVANGFRIQDTSGDGVYSGLVSFNAVDLTRYVKYMMTPAQLFLSEEGQAAYDKGIYNRIYEIYLSKSEIDPNDEDVQQKMITIKVDSDTVDIGAEDLIIEGADSNTDIQEALRNEGAILKFEIVGEENKGTIEKLNIEGLDPNTPYYAQARVKVEKWKKVGETYTYIGDEQSIYSKYVSFTTNTRPTPPTPDEKYPPAPDAFGIKDSDTGVIIEPLEPLENPVNLYWEEAEFVESAEGEIYYEVLRSDGQAIKPEHDKYTVSIEDLVEFQEATDKTEEDLSYHYEFFSTEQIGGKDGYVEMYNQDTNVWENITPHISIDENRIQDKTLKPNEVYYYYIRTIHKVDGEELRSAWIMVPVTTLTLGRPIQLQVESAREYDHNTMNEVVVSFLAPLPKDATIGANGDYDFEIAIRGEEDNRYYTAGESGDGRDYEADAVTEVSINDTVYRKFVYKLSELEHATRYDIKVRIVDRTEGADEYTYSLYSDKATARTDFDEDKDEEDSAFDKYLEQYDKEVEKLKNQSAWKVDSNFHQNIYKYRRSHLVDEIGSEDTYQIVFEEGTTDGYYYLPFDTFEMTQKTRTMFEIQAGNYTIYLRDGILKANEDIAYAKQYIEDGRAEDAYIALDIQLNRANSYYYGNLPLSYEVLIDMELVFVDQKDMYIEDEILDSLLTLIEVGREYVIEDLEKQLDRGGVDEEELDLIIDETIEWIVEEHQEEVEDIMDDETERTYSFETIEEPMLMIAELDAFDVKGYVEKVGSKHFSEVPTFETLGGFAMEMQELGTYVFTGNSGKTELLPHIPGASDLISKYNLTDFFELDQDGLQAYLEKPDMYGAVARMVGAQRGTDYTIALQNRGIKLVMPQNTYHTMRLDETIHLVMQAYEKLYYKPIQSIHIANKQSVQNISAFQPQYRDYVYAAVQLGVVEPRGGKLNPSQPVTVETFIRMLTKIMPR